MALPLLCKTMPRLGRFDPSNNRDFLRTRDDGIPSKCPGIDCPLTSAGVKPSLGRVPPTRPNEMIIIAQIVVVTYEPLC